MLSKTGISALIAGPNAEKVPLLAIPLDPCWNPVYTAGTFPSDWKRKLLS